MIDVGGGIDVVGVGREEKRSSLDSANGNQQPDTTTTTCSLVGTNEIHHRAFHTCNLAQLHQENFHLP